MSTYQKITFAFFLILGVLVQITPVIRSGLTYEYGIGYWGPSGHDSVWHLSLINAINNPLSIDMPIFAGEKLINYHPFFNIFIAFVSKATSISSELWLFQLSPILFSITLLVLSYILGKLVTGKHAGGIILLLLNSLATSLGPIVSLIRHGNFQGESLFWAMQSPSNQINPPYTLSLILLTTLLILIYKKSSHYAIFFLLLITLPITKAYSAVVGFSVYFMYTLRQVFFKKQYSHLLTFVLSLVVAISLFRIYNPESQNLFLFKPFWFINSMIDSPDKLFLPKVSSLRQTLESSSAFDIRLPLVYIFSFIIFIVGNYGFRLLGFIRLNSLPRLFNVSLLLNIIFLTLIPTLFIQQGTSWNTIQFIYYALFISNIYLTLFINSVIKHNWGKIVTVVIFIFYTLGFFGAMPNYLGGAPPAFLPTPEIQALDFLRSQKKGIVLTVPYDKYIKDSLTAPVPLYAYETTSYVSAYSHQTVYMEDEMNLNNSGYDFQTRRQLSLDFFSQKDIHRDRGFLLNNNIDYIYLTGVQTDRFPLDTKKLFLTTIFESGDTIIYQVQK
jgi:hypothetical protein